MRSLSTRARALCALATASVALAVPAAAAQAQPSASTAQLPIPQMPGAQMPAPQTTMPDGKPKGTVIAMSGGSWWGLGPQIASTTLQMTQQFTDLGFKVVTLAAVPGAAGLPDMTKLVDGQIAKAGKLPVCLFGEGAGGQWALTLTAMRQKIDCVMAFAAPAGFEGLSGMISQMIGQAFSPLEQMKLDPMALAPKIDVPALIAYAKADEMIPAALGLKLDRLMPMSVLKTLGPGSMPWVNGTGVNPADAASLKRSSRHTLRKGAKVQRKSLRRQSRRR